jgi:hypothetical protein
MKTAEEFLKEKKIWLGTKVVDMTAPEKHYDLEELMEEYASQQWISVEDRLPEHLQDIVFYSDFKNTHCGIFNAAVGLNQFLSAGRDMALVTHWMPLPTPPTT